MGKKWELNWQNSKLVLRHIKSYKGRNNGLDMGYGVFAKSSIRAGEILVIFGGYVIPIKKIRMIPKQLQEYCYQVHDRFFYGPIKVSDISISEHYNHSCDPNAGFKDSITLVSIKNIKKEEEITMDYAMCVTSHIFDFKCDCKSSFCRKYISGSDWKLPLLQRKYKNYFQPYILEKINNKNKKI